MRSRKPKPEDVYAIPEDVQAKPEDVYAIPEDRRKYLDSIVDRTRDQAIKYLRRWLVELGVAEYHEVRYVLSQIFKKRE